MKIRGRNLSLLTLSLTLVSGLAVAQSTGSQTLSDQEQIALSRYALDEAIQKRPEMKNLQKITVDQDAFLSGSDKLETILTNPMELTNVVSGSFRQNGVDQTSASDVRLTSWNIAYGTGVKLIAGLMSSQNGISLDCSSPKSELGKEECALQQSDIIVLNEADKGVCRSGSIDTAAQIAKAKGMNMVYGPEFFEAEPVYHGISGVDAGSKEITDACSKIAGQGNDHSNLTGNAILSRFPISNVRNISLPIGYVDKLGNSTTKDGAFADCRNWFEDEAKEPTLADKAIQFGIKNVFADDDLRRELRYGTRHALIADVSLPDGQTITIAALHLEDKSKPSCRYAQMNFVLHQLKGNKYPVAIAGDMNTTGENGGSRSTAQTIATEIAQNTIESPSFYANVGLITLPTGVGPGITATKDTVTYLTTHRNPTRTNVPYFRPSPEGSFFKLLKKNGILWQGNASASIDGKNDGPWSVTNQRAQIGFKGTSYLPRTYMGLGEAKIDWIFFKPAKSSNIEPKFPRTLEAIRNAMGKNFPSDHVPVTVLLQASPDSSSQN